jgi:hypothetical protein
MGTGFELLVVVSSDALPVGIPAFEPVASQSCAGQTKTVGSRKDFTPKKWLCAKRVNWILWPWFRLL